MGSMFQRWRRSGSAVLPGRHLIKHGLGSAEAILRHQYPGFLVPHVALRSITSTPRPGHRLLVLETRLLCPSRSKGQQQVGEKKLYECKEVAAVRVPLNPHLYPRFWSPFWGSEIFDYYSLAGVGACLKCNPWHVFLAIFFKMQNAKCLVLYRISPKE
ncbi:hypothetical protein BKA82DRAFT_4047601 [Pisolithus tinctorius]|nr:hypothetical protein BKA82DRAFT_4047601 [Pisolithus tinctorius]